MDSTLFSFDAEPSHILDMDYRQQNTRNTDNMFITLKETKILKKGHKQHCHKEKKIINFGYKLTRKKKPQRRGTTSIQR